MKKRYTDEDILRFLYDEMNQAESEALLTELVSDEELWQRYETLQGAIEDLTVVSYDPSEDSLTAIRDYVRRSRPQEEEQTIPSLSTSSVSAKRLYLGGFSINLQALVGVALGVFLMLTVAGSAIKLSREKFANPNTGKLVENQGTRSDASLEGDSRFDWEMNDIDQNLEKIKEGLQTLDDRSVM